MIKSQVQWDAAAAKVKRIRDSTDSQVRYRDIRPIITIRQMFDASADEYADRTAFYHKDIPGDAYRAVTYAQAQRDIEGLGTKLIDLQLSGKRIAVIGENCYQWAAAYLAVVGGVGTVVPLDKELPGNELIQLINRAEVEAVIFSRKFHELFVAAKEAGEITSSLLISMNGEETCESVISFEDAVKQGRELIEKGDTRFQEAGMEIDPKAMGMLLFTSGTTGIAKGVMLSHENICEDLMSMVALIHIKKEDIFFSVLPIHHTYECTCGFLCPLYRGAAIAYCEGLRYLLKNLSEIRPTILLAVPMLFENFYKKIWSQARKKGLEQKMRLILRINRVTKKIGIDLVPWLLSQVAEIFGGRMRLMICGGAAIDPAVIEGIQEFGINALRGYGLTECGPIAALNPDIDGKPESAGRMIPDIELRIDQTETDGIGEICVRGKNVMLGYYEEEEATADVLKEGWFYTGDLGYLDEDGYLHITGRKKNVIITKNGKNVFPEEIEYYLGKIPYVEESMVWGAESKEAGEVLIFASIKTDEETVIEALGSKYTDQQVEALLWREIDQINAGLPFFKRIKKISVRKEAFEKTTAQKIKRFVDANKE